MREAFERAVARHKNSVFSLAYYHVGNRQEAEDVTQEVLLKLWRSFETLPSEAIAPWLNRVTRNASIDSLRKRTRARRFVIDDASEERMESMIERVATTDAGPADRAESADFVTRVRAALRDLPEPYRTSMILREIQELSYREIGESLELPTNTIKTHVHRGRRMLRERLMEKERDVATSLH